MADRGEDTAAEGGRELDELAGDVHRLSMTVPRSAILVIDESGIEARFIGCPNI